MGVAKIAPTCRVERAAERRAPRPSTAQASGAWNPPARRVRLRSPLRQADPRPDPRQHAQPGAGAARLRSRHFTGRKLHGWFVWLEMNFAADHSYPELLARPLRNVCARSAPPPTKQNHAGGGGSNTRRTRARSRGARCTAWRPAAKGRRPCLTTAPHLPPWTFCWLGARLHTPEGGLSSTEAGRGLRSSPPAA